MPRYLTINDDLQIVIGDGCRFLSKSSTTLDHAELSVGAWLDEHPDHPRRQEASQWLDNAGDKIVQLQILRGLEAKRLEREEMRRMVRAIVRQQLWERKVKFADLDRRTDQVTDEIMQSIMNEA